MGGLWNTRLLSDIRTMTHRIVTPPLDENDKRGPDYRLPPTPSPSTESPTGSGEYPKTHLNRLSGFSLSLPS